MTQKVLVTGSSGFVGSHTANALTRAGYDVVLFDRVKPQAVMPRQTAITGDVLDRAALKDAAKGCAFIYHFAGIADIGNAADDPHRACETNILGTINALDVARAVGAKRFVFASTVYVYSNAGGIYRATKQSCENLIEVYQERYNLPYTILRYGSLYGRRAGPENGIQKLIRSAIETGEIVYNGDPDAMREYIHVADAAKLSVKILEDQYANRHIVLTGHERMRVVDLMRMIAEMLPNTPKIRFGEKTLEAHYTMTPYNYSPKLGLKLTGNDHIDLWQGLLDCIAECHEQYDPLMKTS